MDSVVASEAIDLGSTPSACNFSPAKLEKNCPGVVPRDEAGPSATFLKSSQDLQSWTPARTPELRSWDMSSSIDPVLWVPFSPFRLDLFQVHWAAPMKRISIETVRADFNALEAVIHYTRAAHFLGLWESERAMIRRFIPDASARLLEAGCGAGRVSLGLWEMGYRALGAFDIAEELLDQARSLARARGADAIDFFHADATRLGACPHFADGGGRAGPFDGALFLFNGLMQIPGRKNRRKALRELNRACRPGAALLFTTHDRNATVVEREQWRVDADRWARGERDPRLHEFGDRYFPSEAGNVFMHLPDRDEILADLAATGWEHEFDALRREIAIESEAVRDFSDECRFWAAHKAKARR